MDKVTTDRLVTRCPDRILPDPSRVIAQLFVPGRYLRGGREGRASGVVDRILDLSDEEVEAALADVMQRFSGRHRDVTGAFVRHAERIANRLDPDAELLSEQRWLLLGATFTHEYSVEAAAVCNPSVVAHPDQSGVSDGALRFLMSTRQIGEGHRSSIGFRTGILCADGRVSLDARSEFTTAGTIEPCTLDADVFRGLARRLRDDAEAIGWVLDRLAPRFTIGELDARLAQLEAQDDTRRDVGETVRRLRALADRTYTARFPATSDLTERVLYPAVGVESNGVEDARFVRFVEDDGEVTYHATYTAFDGLGIVQQLLTSTDFLTFTAAPLLGAAAANKGMALFPRRVGGQLAALSRFDGASNAIAFSHDRSQWLSSTPLECPAAAWEVTQLGNCGPPMETEEGWLVLTHGVGPMRTYSIGAWLLDLEDPTRIIGRLREPLITPQADEQDGYVPNVVYSCGALLHESTLMVPYGVGDSSIRFATVDLAELLAAMDREVAVAASPAG